MEYYVPVVGVWHDPPLRQVLGFQKDSPNTSEAFLFIIDDTLFDLLKVGTHEGEEGWWTANTIFIPPFSLYVTREEAEEAIQFAKQTVA